MRKSGQRLIVETGTFDGRGPRLWVSQSLLAPAEAAGVAAARYAFTVSISTALAAAGEAAAVRQPPCGSDKGRIERLVEMGVVEAMVVVWSTESPQRQKTGPAATLAMAAAVAVEQLSPLVPTGSFPTAVTAAGGSQEKLSSSNLPICPVGTRLEIEIGESGGGGGGGEGFENGELGSAGSNGFVRFVPKSKGGRTHDSCCGGEQGDRGNPTSIQISELAKYGVHGSGTIRVGLNDEMSNECLIWERQPRRVAATRSRRGTRIMNSLRPLRSGIDYIQPAGRTSRRGADQAYRPSAIRLQIVGLLEVGTLDAVGLLGFDVADADHVSAVLDGRELLRGRDVRDRIANLLSIRATLRALFRDLEVENRLVAGNTRNARQTNPTVVAARWLDGRSLARKRVCGYRRRKVDARRGAKPNDSAPCISVRRPPEDGGVPG